MTAQNDAARPAPAGAGAAGSRRMSRTCAGYARSPTRDSTALDPIVVGAGDQTFTGAATAAAGDLTDVVIDKASGTLFLAGASSALWGVRSIERAPLATRQR